MIRHSAGILLFRYKNTGLEVFLIHPGGPYWAKKDAGSWSLPKGEFEENESPFFAALREFREETGFDVEKQTEGEKLLPLTPVKQPGGKIIHAWAAEGDCDASAVQGNSFMIQWPPRSGKQKEFPEVDRAEWFPIKVAYEKILPGQTGFLDQLCALLAYDPAAERG